MEPIDTITRDGWTAEIHYDDLRLSSPADWDTVGILAYYTRDASVNADDLPSDHYGRGRFVDDCAACDGTGASNAPGEACPRCDGYGCVADGEAIAKRIRGAVVCLPVRAVDMGANGTSLSIADDWDEANGWIYATAETIATTGVDLDAVPAALEAELRTWQQWAQGDVYGYVVKDPAGAVVESVWGFYGLDDVTGEARSVLGACIMDEAEQARKIRNMMRI